MFNIFLVLFILSGVWAAVTLILALIKIIKVIFADKYAVYTELAKMEVDRQVAEEAEKSGIQPDNKNILNKFLGVPSTAKEYKIRKGFPLIAKSFLKIIFRIWLTFLFATIAIANATPQIQQRLGLSSFKNPADYFMAFFFVSIAAAIVLGGISVFIVVISLFFQIIAGLSKDKIETQGIITGFTERRHGADGQRMYHPTVEFNFGGETITFTSRIGQAWTPTTNKQIVVMFDPKEPKKAEIKSKIPLIFLIIFLLFFSFITFNIVSKFISVILRAL